MVNGLGYTTSASEGNFERAKGSEQEEGASQEGTIGVQVEFGGGLDLLFSRQPLHKLRLPSQSSLSPKPADMRFLIDYLAKNVLKEREELFREGETIRPGILVLINDTDWELENELEYELQDGDEVVFISTLHGG